MQATPLSHEDAGLVAGLDNQAADEIQIIAAPSRSIESKPIQYFRTDCPCGGLPEIPRASFLQIVLLNSFFLYSFIRQQQIFVHPIPDYGSILYVKV
jgi:hypothetical protein